MAHVQCIDSVCAHGGFFQCDMLEAEAVQLLNYKNKTFQKHFEAQDGDALPISYGIALTALQCRDRSGMTLKHPGRRTVGLPRCIDVLQLLDQGNI